VDKHGQTIDFLLAAKRDASAAKRCFRKALNGPQNPHPRVINVDKNPAYPAAVKALKEDGTLHRHRQLRQCKFLNNVVEQAALRERPLEVKTDRGRARAPAPGRGLAVSPREVQARAGGAADKIRAAAVGRDP